MKNPLIPTKCPSCSAPLIIEGIHLLCNNSACEEQLILKIVHFCKARGMEFFSESSIRSLFDAKKIKNIRDLYNLTMKSFEGMEGFGLKKAKNAIEQIENTKEMNIGEFVDALGVDSIGEKAITKLGIKTEKDLLDFKDSTYVIGQNLIEYIKSNRKFVEDLLSVVIIKKPKEAKMGAKKIAMTGAGSKKREELIDDIEKKGDIFVSSVVKGTDILLCEDVNSGSSKLQKAEKMGVKIMNYSEYFN